jgi:hypothetical protein
VSATTAKVVLIALAVWGLLIGAYEVAFFLTVGAMIVEGVERHA